MTDENEVQRLIDDGMARQLQAFEAALAAGLPRVGWKIGINDPVTQQRIGLSGPLVGWLDGRRVFKLGAPYRPSEGARPRIEAETALFIGADLPPGPTLEEARAAITAAAPAIEFVDGTKPLSPLNEMLANDILHDGVLFGREMDVAQASGLVGAGFPSVTLNGVPHRSPIAGRYPEDLAEIVVNVATVLGSYGQQLRAGDRIICGSYIDPFEVESGNTVTADFGMFGNLSFKVE